MRGSTTVKAGPSKPAANRDLWNQPNSSRTASRDHAVRLGRKLPKGRAGRGLWAVLNQLRLKNQPICRPFTYGIVFVIVVEPDTGRSPHRL